MSRGYGACLLKGDGGVSEGTAFFCHCATHTSPRFTQLSQSALCSQTPLTFYIAPSHSPLSRVPNPCTRHHFTGCPLPSRHNFGGVKKQCLKKLYR